MGWSNGSELMNILIHNTDYYLEGFSEGYSKIEFYKEMIKSFENYDCDTLYECLGESPYFDKAYQELYPEHYDELMEN